MSSDAALLVDFGSTYTKARAVDLSSGRLIASAQAPSTVSTDVTIGLTAALEKLERAGAPSKFRYRLASSSAAGGLRMVTVGLVPELTAEAARMAALGAGAKVVGVFSYALADEDLQRIEELKPDVLLLAGGTDGGNASVITANATALAASALRCPVIAAGNRVAAAEVKSRFREAGKELIVTRNVMPTYGTIDIDSAQAAIRDIFVREIVRAKGIDRAADLLDAVLLPTPAAVLAGARLLAEGAGAGQGLGDLMVVDPGGATTDVHTVCDGAPADRGVLRMGLPEPYLKRTVEGDLGLRLNAVSILETSGAAALGNVAGLSADVVSSMIHLLARNVEALPSTSEDAAIDTALACIAVDLAIRRHAGRVEVVYGSEGPVTIQRGKDLTALQTIVGTGGVLAYGARPEDILRAALGRDEDRSSLRPRLATLSIDRNYVLFACGLLAEVEPEAAFRLGVASLTELPEPSAYGVGARA